MTAPGRRTPSPMVVAMVSLGLAGWLIGSALWSGDWDPTVFVGFGEDAHATTEYAESRVGEVSLRRAQGHDGKYFFVQANDPLLFDPANNAAILDLPIYRSQRMLYPLVAGGFGLFGPETILWALVAVNVLALAVGTLAASRIAMQFGASPMWGLAFGANIGILFALLNNTAGALAAALAFWAVAMINEKRTPAAVALLTGSVLTREVMLVCALGLAIWLWSEGKRRAATFTLVVPTAAFLCWILYLRAQLGPDEVSPGATGLPFVGLVRAVPRWMEDPLALIVGVSVAALIVGFVIRWAGSRGSLGWAFIGFVPMATLLTERVWGEIFDFTRALAPMLTAAVLVIFIESKRSRSSLEASNPELGAQV